MKKYVRVSGKRAAIYLRTQAQRLNDAAGQARQEAEVELPADGAAIDMAFKLCRYCFNEYRRMKKALKKNRENRACQFYFTCAQDERFDSFLMFCDLLTANLGIDKDC